MARAAVERALDLDPTLAEAHAVHGSLLANFDWRFVESEAAFRRALELKPGDAASMMGLAQATAALGDTREAIIWADRAIDVDPLNLPLRLNGARILCCARRFDEALNEQSRVIAIDPTLQVAHVQRAATLHYLGRFSEAIGGWRTAVDLAGLPHAIMAEVFGAYERGGIRAFWKAWLVHAEDIASETRLPLNWLWVPYAAIGDLDHAFQWLERDYEGRGAELAYLKVNPFFDSLRPDPRFQLLLERIGRAADRAAPGTEPAPRSADPVICR